MIHIKLANQSEPVLEDRNPNISFALAAIYDFAPARRETIQRAAFMFHIALQIALEVLNAHMDQHVHALEARQFLDD